MICNFLSWQATIEDAVEQVDSKVHLKKLVLHQKRQPLTVKLAGESKRVKEERPEGEVVRRSERLLANKLRQVAKDSQHGRTQGLQLKRKERRKGRNSSKQ